MKVEREREVFTARFFFALNYKAECRLDVIIYDLSYVVLFKYP